MVSTECEPIIGSGAKPPVGLGAELKAFLSFRSADLAIFVVLSTVHIYLLKEYRCNSVWSHFIVHYPVIESGEGFRNLKA